MLISSRIRVYENRIREIFGGLDALLGDPNLQTDRHRKEKEDLHHILITNELLPPRFQPSRAAKKMNRYQDTGSDEDAKLFIPSVNKRKCIPQKRKKRDTTVRSQTPHKHTVKP